MQLGPSSRTPISRALDIIEWWLRQISINNGFITDGPIVVNRNHDTRLLKDDQLSGYRISGTRATIKLGDQKLLQTQSTGMRGTVGGVKRELVKCDIIVNQTVSKAQDEAGVTLDKVQSWLTWDWKYGAVYNIDSQGRPLFVSTASTALNAADPTWHTPSMFNVLVTDVLSGPVLTFPNCIMVWRMQWMMDVAIRQFSQMNF